MKFQFPVSNNEAAKEALCASSHMAKSLQLTHILVRSDSQVIVGQVIGEFEAKEDNMQKYLECVQQLSSEFSQILFGKESWEENMCADMLSKLSVREPTEEFKQFCEELGIEQSFTSVAYPHRNGDTKVTNSTTLQGLKKRLHVFKGSFIDKYLKHLDFEIEIGH
ncbi:hypothetical protein M9H77_29784 [Catharanthus roseus]|uniref:Uncharacterized protein n=1 Tax=Catharanthus roseus TaxID=4058 RepID=A0ACB9ZWP8_CATRO|nr:hypothetical protein M9H77_29784 [Catharanthus roseus]